jgi:stage II sporulation protein AA (anti-sigma F factor antagonist)
MFDDGVRIDAFHSEGVLTLSVRGEIDMASAPRLHGVLERSIARTKRLSLDLSGVSFMDSSGVNLLLRAAVASRDLGGSLSVVAASRQVRQVLQISGVAEVVGLEPELADTLS